MQRISTAIEIDAAANRVWAVLMDFAAYPEWNPFIRKLSGNPAPGGRLRVTVQPPDGRTMSFEPQVLVCDPGREFRWRGRLLVAGLFDGEHVFRLSEHRDGACRLVHEECFSGLLVPCLMRGALRAGTGAGFEMMNRALKQRVERGAA